MDDDDESAKHVLAALWGYDVNRHKLMWESSAMKLDFYREAYPPVKVVTSILDHGSGWINFCISLELTRPHLSFLTAYLFRRLKFVIIIYFHI